MAPPVESRAGGFDLEAGWELATVDGAAGSVRFVFGETEIRRAFPGLTLGRHPALCHLVMDRDTVSRRHARISLAGSDLLLEDLHSLNGTRIDGIDLSPYAPVPVSDGALIEFADVRFRLRRIAG